jgi:hypothetical protein
MGDQTSKWTVKGLKTEATSTKLVLVALVLLLGGLVVAPFYFSRTETKPDGDREWALITTHDLPNYVPMMKQFDKVLRSGVLYPRWDPDFNRGYGTATANFYPPGTFYTTSLINFVLDNWTITLFILCALSLAGSGFTFYLLSRAFYGRFASALAALFYMLLPFHQMDLYWRGGIPQFVGYAFMPVVLYLAFRLGSEGRLKYYALLGGVHGIYLMSHIPVGYLFTYVVALYAVLWAFREKDPKIALRIAGGISISLLVSAIYWLPAALEGKYAYEWATEVFPYHYLYVSLSPTPDPFSIRIQDVFTYNALVVIATIVILRAMRKSISSYSDHDPSSSEVQRIRILDSQTGMWIILGIVTPLMCTSFSIYISQLIPKIQIATPPFRWLAIACLFTSLLVAASIDVLKQRGPGTKTHLAYKLALGAAIVLNLWVTGNRIIAGALSNPTFVASAEFVDGGFTPKGSTSPDKLPDTAAVTITPEGGASELIQWGPTHRVVGVRVDQPSQMRLKTYNFRGWTARINGEVVPLLSDQDGIQLVELPPGNHIVQISFESTPPRIAGTVISAIGLLAILGIGFATRTRVQEVEPERTNQQSGAGAAGDQPAMDRPDSSARRPGISWAKRIGWITLVAVFLTGVLVMTRRSDDKTGRTGSTSDSRSNQRAGAASQGVGDEAHLYLAGRNSVMLAADEKASHEMISALSSNDQGALEEMIKSGRALTTDNNTRVRVLHTTSGLTKVRILEGPLLMTEGWVPERWLR